MVAAVESARSLRELLEFLPSPTAVERSTLQHQLNELQRWLQAAETDSAEYRAVIDGLARFAHHAETLMARPARVPPRHHG